MKITIEQIEGRPYTCIMSGAVRTADKGGDEIPEGWNTFDVEGLNGKIITIGECTLSDGATVRGVCAVYLPPLPRNPKPEDAKLLHLYAAHGLAPTGKKDLRWKGHIAANQHMSSYGVWIDPEVTHAMHNGERVGIAIEEGA